MQYDEWKISVTTTPCEFVTGNDDCRFEEATKIVYDNLGIVINNDPGNYPVNASILLVIYDV